jgi:hypothetical protein
VGVSAWWAVIPLGVALIGAFAAFGGRHATSSGPSSPASPAASRTSLSASDYLARVNAVCRDARFDLASLPAATTPGMFRDELIRMRTVTSHYGRMIAALTPPPELQAAAQRALATTQAQLPEFDRLAADAGEVVRLGQSRRLAADLRAAKQLSTQANQAWRQVGATDCA